MMLRPTTVSILQPRQQRPQSVANGKQATSHHVARRLRESRSRPRMSDACREEAVLRINALLLTIKTSGERSQLRESIDGIRDALNDVSVSLGLEEPACERVRHVSRESTQSSSPDCVSLLSWSRPSSPSTESSQLNDELDGNETDPTFTRLSEMLSNVLSEAQAAVKVASIGDVLPVGPLPVNSSIYESPEAGEQPRASEDKNPTALSRLKRPTKLARSHTTAALPSFRHATTPSVRQARPMSRHPSYGMTHLEELLDEFVAPQKQNSRAWLMLLFFFFFPLALAAMRWHTVQTACECAR